MSDKTHAALVAASEAYQAARSDAELSGQDPGGVPRAGLEKAAQAHLDEVDPGYRDREGGKAPHERVPAPDLKAAYDEALEDKHAHPGDQELAAKATALGEQYAVARQAARLVDTDRPAGITVHAEGGE